MINGLALSITRARIIRIMKVNIFWQKTRPENIFYKLYLNIRQFYNLIVNYKWRNYLKGCYK